MCGISVIIPCYQAESTINRCVASVACQTLLPVELIIVNDGSDDDTIARLLDIQRNWDNRFALKIIHHLDNKGVAVARNTGWQLAKGQWLAFLDADDTWHSDKLAVQSKWMDLHQNADVSCHTMQMRTLENHSNVVSRRLAKKSLLFKNQVLTSTVMLKREIPLRFIESQRYSEDYRLWLQLVFNGYNIYCLAVPMAQRYKASYGVSGLTSKLWLMERGELSNYVAIFKEGHVSLLTFLSACLFSIAKFVKRFIVSFFR